MMRDFINAVANAYLCEAWFGNFEGDIGNYDMFKNPSKMEIAKILAASQHNQLRAIVTEHDMYVWDAALDIHFGAFEHLEMEYDKDGWRILIDRQGPFINQYDPMVSDEHEGDVDVEAHQALLRTITTNLVFIRLFGKMDELPLR